VLEAPEAICAIANVLAVLAAQAPEVPSAERATITLEASAINAHWFVRVPPAVVADTQIIFETTIPAGRYIPTALTRPELKTAPFTPARYREKF
jgi:uncharacterized protein (DUF427 family)